jgi:uncharacterized repeat protein (TIGR04138 family)
VQKSGSGLNEQSWQKFMKKNFSQIARDDGRYNSAAVKFVYEGLDCVLKKNIDEPQHINGQVLCEGLKELALKKWGRLAKLVLNNWGVKNTRDFGEIVYLMIENKWMSAQPTDSIDDFNNIYDFNSVFKERFKFQPNDLSKK